MKQTQINTLIKLKNLSLLNRDKAIIPLSQKSIDIIEFLYSQGGIQSYSVTDTNIIVYLRRFRGKSFLSGLKIVSKPSVKKHLKYHELCRLTTKKTLIAFSNSYWGLMSLDEIKLSRSGGTILFYVS